MLDELFPSTFIEGVQLLRIVARHRVAGLERGEHTARRAGTGLDFRDYRAYVPGDDPRRIDWNVYRRSGRLTTRLYDEVERLAVYVLLDTSSSMFFESPPRANAGRQLVVALVSAALRQHDRATVFPFGASLGPPIRILPQRGLPMLLHELAGLKEAGATDLDAVIANFERLRLPSGLVVVVSDFFDQRGIESTLAAIGRLRHRIALVQLTRAADRDPLVSGDVRLLDCESDAPLEVGVDAATLAAYRAAYDRFQTQLDHFAMRRQALLARIDTQAPILDQLHLLFPGGVLHL